MKLKHLLAVTAFLVIAGCSPKTYMQIDYLQDIDEETSLDMIENQGILI